MKSRRILQILSQIAVDRGDLTESEIADHKAAIEAAADAESLKAAFSSAWQHATQAKDSQTASRFKAAYEARKPNIAA